MEKLSRDELVSKHRQAKVYYFAETKQQSCIRTAMTSWSKSKDSKKDIHVARLEKRLSESIERQNKLKEQIVSFETEMKHRRIKFEALYKGNLKNS